MHLLQELQSLVARCLDRIYSTAKFVGRLVRWLYDRITAERITATAALVGVVGAAVTFVMFLNQQQLAFAATKADLSEMCDLLAGPRFASDLRLRVRSIDELAAFHRKLDSARVSGGAVHEVHRASMLLSLHEGRYKHVLKESLGSCGSRECKAFKMRVHGSALYSLWSEGGGERSFNQLLAFYHSWAEDDLMDAYPLAVKATMLLLHSQPSEADHEIGRALRRTNNLARAYEVKGRIQRVQGQLSQARDSFDEALRLDPLDVAARVNRANLLAAGNRENIHRAIRELQLAGRLDPEHADVHYNLGVCAQRLRRPMSALENFDASLQLDRFQARTHIGRADALISLGRLEEAVDAASAALDVEVSSAGAYHNRAVANLLLGRSKAALEDAMKAVECEDTTGAKILIVAAQSAHAAEDHEAEAKLTAAALAIEKSSVDAMILSSQSLRETGDTSDLEKAVAVAESAVAVDSRNANAWVALGFAYAERAQSNDEQLALRCFRQAHACGTVNARCYLVAGTLLRKAEKQNEALVMLERAKHLVPKDPEVCYQLGAVLMELGRPDAARVEFQRGLEMNWDVGRLWYGLTQANTSVGLWSDALASADMYLGLKPDHSPAHALRGKVLHELGRHCHAARAYATAQGYAKDRAEFASDLASEENHCSLESSGK